MFKLDSIIRDIYTISYELKFLSTLGTYKKYFMLKVILHPDLYYSIIPYNRKSTNTYEPNFPFRLMEVLK